MNFDLDKSLEILEATPSVLSSMLEGLSGDWTHVNEGGESWSAFDIVGHLIHGESASWIPRLEIILSDDDDKEYEPFDRFEMLDLTRNSTLEELLKVFSELRAKNLRYLESLHLTEADLEKRGAHPAFGSTSGRQLVATWVVHDLSHIAQIARVMAKQYREEVGPWQAYLRILEPRTPTS